MSLISFFLVEKASISCLPAQALFHEVLSLQYIEHCVLHA
jgi:hypothetical protein